jgi:predicted branched-subunit amino acid permease
MLTNGVYVSEIIFTTFILNLRHFLMTASIGQRLETSSTLWRFSLAFGMTDETFSVASLQKSPIIGKKYLLGLNLIAYAFWNIGTVVGLFLSSSIPSPIQQSMGIALYAMFIGLLMPSIRGSRKVLVVVLFAVGVQLILSAFGWLSNGWRIIIATICGAGAGVVLFGEEEKHEQ